MTYHEAIDRLYDLKRHSIEPGTGRTAAMLGVVDDPQHAYESVQIAGTNGKGSTAVTLASILEQAGNRVGVYTSPHLDSVRERIRVNGRPISQAAITRFVDRIGEHLDTAGETPTFFEAVTAMALWYFEEMAVDIAVLEVGIGGRHDATSVVDPVAAAVTSVALDHTEVLGDTIEEIAEDKMSIAAGDVPLVTGATGTARRVILGDRGDATVVGADPEADIHVDYGGVGRHLEADLTLTGPDWSIDAVTPLLGSRQGTNVGVAATLAKTVWAVDDDTIARGIRGVEYPGRAEVVELEPLVILDGAHNPDASEHLSSVLRELSYESLHLVVGAMGDKDIAGVCERLPPAATVATCRPASDRAASERVVARAFEAAGYETVATHRTVDGAVSAALDAAADGDAVCVTGSLYTVAEARRRWSRRPLAGRFETISGVETAMRRTSVTDAGITRMRSKGVHRSVRLSVTHRQAAYLKQELLSAGGECAVSGVTADGELVDVLLLATIAQYDRVLRSLAGQTQELAVIGDQLRRALGIRHEPSWDAYPWAGDETAIMGIVNVTPDSFYDGGEADTVAAARERAREQVAAGAAIIDIGGESTRPGGDPVSLDDELDRVIPVIEAVADCDALVSVDTQKAEVAEAAIRAGADLVNDVSGLADPSMAPTVADLGVPIVLGHSLSTPVDPGLPVEYDDVVASVASDLDALVRRCERVGIDRSSIILDPGIGFNKAPMESFELIGRVGELRSLGCPVLIGHSQKSMFGGIGYDIGDRDAPTLATSAIAAARGADILRVHHVEPTVAAVRAAEALTRWD